MTAKIKDKILYNQLKEKDKEAFIKSYDLYVDDIYRYVYFKVSNKEEAEDITSSIFLKAWDYINNNKITDFDSLKAFYYKIARNTVIDHYRKNSNKNEISIDVEIDNSSKIDLVDEKQDIAHQIDVKISTEKVMLKINELKDEYREVIMLRYVNEMSTKEIAGIIDKSSGNTRVLIYRAVKSLKILLEDKNG